MPKIGLLSDSHGQAEATRQAVGILLDAGAEILLHMGDIGSVEAVDALAVTRRSCSVDGPTVRVEAHIVFGNVDWDVAVLSEYARHLGVHVDHPVGRLSCAGGQLVFLHGDRPARIRQAIAEGAKYVCHGHTHLASDQTYGPTRLICPGALSRTHRNTVALLDTDADELMFYEVQGC